MVVLWDGTRRAVSGTPYLVADDIPTRAAPVDGDDAPQQTLRSRIAAVLEARGPSTAREIADVLGGDLYKLNGTICNMRASGDVVMVEMRPVAMRTFGVRYVSVYGLVPR